MKLRLLIVVLAVVAVAFVVSTSCPAAKSTTQLTCAKDKEAGDANKPADPNKCPGKDPNKATVISLSDFSALADADAPKSDKKDPNKPDPNKPADPNKSPGKDPNKATVVSLSDFSTFADADAPKCDKKDPNKTDPNKPADPNCKK